MKKFVSFMLCLALAASMTACGSSSSSSTTTTAAETTAAETTAAASEAAGDTSAAAEETTGAAGETTAAATGETEEITDLAAYAEEGMTTEITCDPIEISLGCSGTVEGTVMGDAVDAACEAISRWTGGNFVVKFYPSAQLGGDSELIESTQMGSVDMFTGAPTSQVSLIPELAVVDIGGLFDTVDACNNVLDSLNSDFQALYEAKGLKLLGMYAPNFRILTSNKEIKTADDLNGLNIRVQENEYHMTFWKSMGCNASPLTFSELYIALQQGMMDAQENPWASITGSKLYEVQKYIIKTNHIPFISTYVMNQAKYEGMSDEQKLAIDQFVEYIKRWQMAGTAADDAKQQKVAEDYGCIVTENEDVPDEIKTLMSTASQAVIDQMKEDIDSTWVDTYVNAAAAQK